MSLPQRIMMLCLFFVVLLGACGNDKPTPQTNMRNVVHAMTGVSKSFQVKHRVKGKDVLIECVAANFPFQKGKNGGHINVYLNGQKINEVYTAAFMLRGLPAGKHVVRLELVYNDGKITGMLHEFSITIP
ncbi:hypothetical protein [Saccharococcus caldoxylosilyticus]|jgi:hypothetical protein|uniref:hypothetical protein n=1 Tax=Saccharococcus caldoxylosilyticus TaxID=81408 RepID=UPI0004744DCA|nr:hypothetical protein BSK33_06085 [Geobacillus sp. 44B]